MKVLVNGEEVELAPDDRFHVQSGGDRLWVKTPEGTFSALSVKHQGKTWVSFRGRTYEVENITASRTKKGAAASGSFMAPMPGLIIEVLVEVGQAVAKGERLLVMEAMKTQQPVLAPFDGTVETLPVKEGEQVAEGVLLVRITPNPAEAGPAVQ